ncbi:hypothetical protein MMC26_005565, partial [Xylographa opegraphella]|nr:hypothetical protein [Xylographa opegraphella]
MPSPHPTTTATKTTTTATRPLFSTTNPFTTNPFTTTPHPLTTTPPSPFHTRPSRSPSTASTATFRSTLSAPSSLAEILAQSASAFYTPRTHSFASSCRSTDRRRSSCFSIEEREEERAVFGDSVVGVLEPRPGVGWWGVGEVLEEGEGG